MDRADFRKSSIDCYRGQEVIFPPSSGCGRCDMRVRAPSLLLLVGLDVHNIGVSEPGP